MWRRRAEAQSAVSPPAPPAPRMRLAPPPGPRHAQGLFPVPSDGVPFPILADALVQAMRPVFPPLVPAGVGTALTGAPVFLLLLARRGAVAND